MYTSFRKITVATLCVLGMATSMVSCSDFFDVDSTHIIDSSEEHLNNATDTIYSVVGILNKLQAIADRTILLGEARGDLMTVTDATSSDLRDVATFNIGDDNQYNKPSDYYAIINNCNYFIAKADTALRNNRKEYIFKKEYAAVKAIRAWTYLQLAINYGSVPFYTKPLLSAEEAEEDFPRYDINQICEYFLDEDGLKDLMYQEYPEYGTIKSLNSEYFYMPMRLVYADLCLWDGRYLEAAKWYHDYLTTDDGTSSKVKPIGAYSASWGDENWTKITSTWTSCIANGNDLITMIPMDSIPSEGHYSQLRNIFNSSSSNDYEVSLVPSKSMIDLSASQVYCYNNGGDMIYPPTNLDNYQTGDLRLSSCWSQSEETNSSNQKYIDQYILKYKSRNVCIYRRPLVYLRLAEAMNRAGYPRYAYHILSTGLNTDVIADSIAPYLSQEDSLLLTTQFNFTGNQLSTNSATNFICFLNPKYQRVYNTIGIHSRGCGFTPRNEYYRMPEGTIEEQQLAVENMIMDEEALEFAFEGYRFYDLMRVALRRNDPSYLANKINNRCGGAATGITVDLNDKNNWFLKWKGQIGY